MKSVSTMPELPTKFADYKDDGYTWVTLATGEFYPDILEQACFLYTPVLQHFGMLVRSSESSERLFLQISAVKESWMRIQLLRVFKRYVSPAMPVEMTKKKRKPDKLLTSTSVHFGLFRMFKGLLPAVPYQMSHSVSYYGNIKAVGKKDMI